MSTSEKLHVGLIAPPWIPVPPSEYGGTELVVDLLARGLVAAGCDVTLFTTGDATCPVERRWVHPHALGTAAPPEAELVHIAAAYEALSDVDVIHDHTITGPARVDLHPTDTPVVTTVHGRFTSELGRHYAAAAAAGVAVVAISDSHRRSAPRVPVASVIHHGIDVDSFPDGPGDGGYVVFLGRMSPDKGVHNAIRIARAAGKRLVIAAKMWQPEEHRYYAERVAPLLAEDVVYIGEVGGQAKLDLLAGAEALINPIRWPEPFGLVMVEAQASGTPVVSYREGSAPELIRHGRTGWLCRDEPEMVTALGRVHELDRAACRAHVREHFSADRMVRDHLALYDRLLSGDQIDLRRPTRDERWTGPTRRGAGARWPRHAPSSPSTPAPARGVLLLGEPSPPTPTRT